MPYNVAVMKNLLHVLTVNSMIVKMYIVKGKRVGLAKLRAGVGVNVGSNRISQKGLAYFC